jgi:hypothetical protein
MEIFVVAGLGILHRKAEAPRRTVSVFKAISGYFAKQRQAESRRAFRRITARVR